MDAKISEFLAGLKGDGVALLKGEINGFFSAAASDSEDFIQKQGKKLERYMTQLATGEITKEQFANYANDLRALAQMHKVKCSVQAQARVQKMVNDIADLLLTRLFALI